MLLSSRRGGYHAYRSEKVRSKVGQLLNHYYTFQRSRIQRISWMNNPSHYLYDSSAKIALPKAYLRLLTCNTKAPILAHLYFGTGVLHFHWWPLASSLVINGCSGADRRQAIDFRIAPLLIQSTAKARACFQLPLSGVGVRDWPKQ